MASHRPVNKLPTADANGMYNGQETCLAPCNCGKPDCENKLVRYVKSDAICWQQLQILWKLPTDLTIWQIKRMFAVKAVSDTLFSMHLSVESGFVVFSASEVLSKIQDKELLDLLYQDKGLFDTGVQFFVRHYDPEGGAKGKSKKPNSPKDWKN